MFKLLLKVRTRYTKTEDILREKPTTVRLFYQNLSIRSISESSWSIEKGDFVELEAML